MQGPDHDEHGNHILTGLELDSWPKPNEHALTENPTGASHGSRQGGNTEDRTLSLGDFEQAFTLLWVSIPPSAKWATSKFPKFKPPIWPFVDFHHIPVLLVLLL